MEGHIILDGFKELYELKMIVTKYIADADSHTYPLLKTLPYSDYI